MLRSPVVPSRSCASRSRAYRYAAALILCGTSGCETLLSPPQYGKLQVTVTTASGQPVAGMYLVLYTGVRPIEYSHTDSSGTHTFERVPPGNYGVTGALPQGMCDAGGSTTMVRDDLVMEPGTARTVAFTVGPCPSTS